MKFESPFKKKSFHFALKECSINFLVEIMKFESTLKKKSFHFAEAINTSFIVFGLTRSRLEPTMYRTRGDHAKHYTTETVEVKNVLSPI
jgi:hypothetical protein